MSSDPNDFRVEIIKSRPQGIVSPTLGSPVSGDVLDVTKYVIRDSVGSVNRATDRDLLSFKTGDMTMAFKNGDGYFDDLFAFFGATDTWGCRVYRRGVAQFYGCLIGLGSITFDRKIKTCEVTVYGLTKLLDMTAADTVKRTIADTTVTTATLGASTLTVASTSGLLSGDTLHLTDHANAEDVTVKQVTSATVVSLEAALVRTYAAGSSVSCTTPFYRYKTISYLVNALFTEAGIGIAEYRISPSQFSTLAPTLQNLSGLPTFAATNPFYTNPAQKDGYEYITQLVSGTRYQTSPDADWIVADATVQAWVDWSPYFVQGSTGPAIVPRTPNDGEAVKGGDPHNCGWDLRGATMTMYAVGATSHRLTRRTSVDGTTWTAAADVTTPDVPGMLTPNTDDCYGCDYDPVRNQVIVYASGDKLLQLYDVAGTTWTDIKPAGEAAKLYGGFSYCADLDCFIGLRGTLSTGTVFDIVAFRGAARLWVRTFPGVLVGGPGSLASSNVWPTDSIRYLNGKLYTVAITDGETQLIVSGDQFVSYTARSVSATGTAFRTFGGRVNNAYLITAYSSTLPRVYLYAAPFYAGVVEYADFDGLSIAEALKKLSVLTNALFFVDNDLQGHFIARDLYDPGNVFDMSNVITDESDDFLWDQTSQYVTASGNSVKATAGLAAFAADGIALDSSFLPNEAFAQALADSYFAFYSALRKYISAGVHDVDGHIYQPMDRVFIDSMRYLVYESDHDLIGDSVSVQLLEDR